MSFSIITGNRLYQREYAGPFMKVKEKIDYVYFCYRKDKKNRVRFVRGNVAQIQVLKVEVIVKGSKAEKIKGNEKAGQRLINKIKKGLILIKELINVLEI